MGDDLGRTYLTIHVIESSCTYQRDFIHFNVDIKEFDHVIWSLYLKLDRQVLRTELLVEYL